MSPHAYKVGSNVHLLGGAQLNKSHLRAITHGQLSLPGLH